jgi:hypothetical protein
MPNPRIQDQEDTAQPRQYFDIIWRLGFNTHYITEGCRVLIKPTTGDTHYVMLSLVGQLSQLFPIKPQPVQGVYCRCQCYK